jgi:DNA polymerase
MADAFDAIPLSADVPIPAGTYVDVDAMVPHCQQCQRCRLGATRTRAAVYRGNPQARLMLIGEGPGEQEDRQGRPFVGPAGQLLDRILAAVGLDPARDAFICNVVKCRPPGNRVPDPDEAAACRPYLDEQIRLVDPAMFVFVGATALRFCTGETRGISRVRGEWLTHRGRPAMAIFHPSYLLRNPARTPGSPKWLMWRDIQAIRARLDELGALSDAPGT